MKIVGRCGNYENRPKFCRDYPQITSYLPEGCTYHFIGEERRGECDPSSCEENNCCSWPREGGEPEATSLDEKAGGLPCKYLIWAEIQEPQNKEAGLYDDVSIGNEIHEALESCICPRRE